MKKKKIFLFIVLVLCLGFVSYLGQSYYIKFQKAKRQNILYEKRKIAWQNLEQKLTLEIGEFKGKSSIVIKDLETGWEFFFDKNKLFPSASLVKVPIMAACFFANDEGKIKLDRNIALKATDKLAGSGLLKEVRPGVTFTVEELIGRMIYDSDNTATNILSNLVGVDYLNKTFKQFGLKNTVLSRRIADYWSREKGIENYTTAQDMALVFEKIYQRNLVNENVSKECLRFLKLQRVNDRIPKYLPVDITVAHKTGLERGVCHDAGIVFTSKGNFLIVVLTKHANSNSIPSKEFIAKVSLHTYNYFLESQAENDNFKKK